MKAHTVKTLKLIGVASLLFAWETTAFAAPPNLKGTYAFTGEAGCLSVTVSSVDDDGFDTLFRPEITSLGPPIVRRGVSVLSFSVQGLRTFNEDGTGTVTGKTVSISFDPSFTSPFTRSASSQEFQASFTYDVDKSGFVSTTLVPGSFVGTFVAGPRTGQTITIEGIVLTGMASVDNKTLTLSTPAPAVETVKFFDEGDDPSVDAPNQIQKRVCHRSRVHIWLGP